VVLLGSGLGLKPNPASDRNYVSTTDKHTVEAAAEERCFSDRMAEHFEQGSRGETWGDYCRGRKLVAEVGEDIAGP
jgi:hypothetical protein